LDGSNYATGGAGKEENTVNIVSIHYKLNIIKIFITCHIKDFREAANS
jgi:hypothetical protein